MSDLSIIEQYQSNLPKWRDFHNRLYALLSELFKYEPIVCKFESRIKSLESIKEKLQRVDKQVLPDIRDIVGFRIVVPTDNDMVGVLRLLASELSIDEIRVYNFQSENLNKIGGLYGNSSIPTSFYVKPDPSKAIFFYSGLSEKRSHLPEWREFQDFRVEIQIKTIFSQAYSEAIHSLHYKKREEHKIDIAAIDVSSRLNYAIDNFQKLIDRKDVHEKRDIHPFLEKHYFLLHPNPADFFSEVAIGLGTEFRIDFLIRESDGKYLMVEIENPRHPLFTKAGEFTNQVNHAIRQVEDWQQWVESNLPMVQKKYPDIVSPSGLLVIGRSQFLTNEERQRLERRNINFRGKIAIWTYDQIIDNAKSFVQSINNNLRNWVK